MNGTVFRFPPRVPYGDRDAGTNTKTTRQTERARELRACRLCGAAPHKPPAPPAKGRLRDSRARQAAHAHVERCSKIVRVATRRTVAGGGRGRARGH